MSLRDRLREWWSGPAAPQKPYPKTTARKTVDEEIPLVPNFKNMALGANQVEAKFPFEIYSLVDDLTLIDPYVNKFHATTISLGNTGHNLLLNAPSEDRADAAIEVANQFAMRAFPLGGGMDGIVNGMFSQIARAGGLCIEWVPDMNLRRVSRGYLVPMKTLRFVYSAKQELVLCQQQGLELVPLNMAQTVFHNLVARDSNPYPIPPAIAGLEAAVVHRKIVLKIKDWMDKISAMGVLLATVERPPREPGESQEAYNSKAQTYLSQIATSISDNMSQGIGVGYDNIAFQFNNTQASAQGAKDVLQIVLQGLFAGLQTDPIFFGWNFNSTETFAKVVYEEMQQRIKMYQLGVKRAIEHGHRLNFAMVGMGDLGVSVQFKSNRSIDAFRDAEAEYMMTQKYVQEIEAGIITKDEARKFLGYDDRAAEAGEFVATFNKAHSKYILVKDMTVEEVKQELSDRLKLLNFERQAARGEIDGKTLEGVTGQG